MSSEKSFIEKLNALKEKNSAERAKERVRLPDATNMKREGDKIALDFYMEALYNMSAEDIQRLDSRQWERMFDTIYELACGDGVGDKVANHLKDKIESLETQKKALDELINEPKRKEIELIEERYASDAEVLEEARKRGEEKVQDFYMEALCNMSAEDIQRIDSRQWKRILDKIYEQARIDVIREKVEKHLNEKSEAEESEDVKKRKEQRKKVEKEISELREKEKKLLENIADTREGIIYTEELFEYYPDVFVKLYSNYRFSKEVYEYLTKMGTAIGEMLAKDTKLNTSAIALNLGEHRKETANEISKNMLDLLYPGARKEGTRPTPVYVTRMGENTYGGTLDYCIKICDREYGDVLGTTIHECLHSYAQSRPYSFSEEMYDKGILPFVSDKEGVSEEIKSFMRVLSKNGYNYVSDSRYEYRIPGALYHAYKKQPKERHSRFVATIAMQVYKEKTKYQRPNNSIDIYNHLKGRFGEPSFVEPYYEDKNKKVRFGYEIDEKVTKEAIEKAMQLTVESEKVDLSKELGLKIEEQTIDDKKFVVFDVPETWEARSKIIPFMRMKDRQKAYAGSVARQDFNDLIRLARSF